MSDNWAKAISSETKNIPLRYVAHTVSAKSIRSGGGQLAIEYSLKCILWLLMSDVSEYNGGSLLSTGT